MTWQDILDHGGIALIDGGTGSELKRRGVAMNPTAWSGTLARTHPRLLQTIHEDFIEAGADVIITNTFGSARYMLDATGLGDQFEAINRSAVELALQARTASGRAVAVAGSISNLPPHMDPAYYPGPDRELTDLQELANLLADSGVDLIALEMMEDSDHARRAMEAALETGLPVWLGVSCRRRAGGLGLTSFDYPHIDFSRPLDALIPMGPAVVNIMHSEISAVGPAMEMVRQRWSGPIGAYPEVGDFTANGSNADPQPTPEHLVRHAQTWVSCGARLIGGCCGTTPAHIRALREAFSH